MVGAMRPTFGLQETAWESAHDMRPRPIHMNSALFVDSEWQLPLHEGLCDDHRGHVP